MEQSPKKHQKKIFIPKIDLPAILAIGFFAGLIFFYMIPGFEKVMMDRKRNLIHEITSSAYSVLEYFHSLETSGVLDSKQAKEQAGSAISTIRYGKNKKDYFWITDMFPRMIVHPYRPDLNGKDLTEFRDSSGKTIFIEFVNKVSSTGESYVDYMWQWNDDSTRIVPKLSYVRLFKPWDWIIGTGIYIDDVRTEIRRMERDALIISGLIGVFIILLLILISRQSHKIENKRNKAEEELLKSKELYRALAEAASEGVLIWSTQGLQLNKTLLSWLDYSEADQPGLNLETIFSSPVITGNNNPESFYEELTTSRYVECVLKTKSGRIIKSYADLSRIFLGKSRAVLAVIRPVESVKSHPDFSPLPALMNIIGTGFFRVTYGSRNKFLYATEPAVRMLGSTNVQDLLPLYIDHFFSDPVQLKAVRSALELKQEITNMDVLLKRKGGDEFRAMINVMVVESDSREIWCEGTIEPIASGLTDDSFPVDISEYSSSFIMSSPVSGIMKQPAACSENQSVSRAVAIMKENNTDIIIVENKNGEPLGIIDAGIIGLRLAEGGSPETEVFRWMSSPPDLIRHNATINEAFGMIRNSLRKCLLVFSDKEKINGIITNTELTNAFFTSPELITSEIEGAVTSSALHSTFLKSQKITTMMILGHADAYAISQYISSVADMITRRVLTLCIEESGPPPCRFAFIQTGSAGRKEQTLATDQDNAIIFENCEGKLLQAAFVYFAALGKEVNNMLSASGFSLCKGFNMAGNPKWCQPVNVWKKYFSDWIKMPGPDELLDISIFFDFRFCYGDIGLTDELHLYIKSDLKTNDIFLHHMAATLKPFNPSVTQLNEQRSDLKRILIPLTGIVRLYSLKYGTKGFSTIDRLIDLHSDSKLDHRSFRNIIRAWKDLTSLRLFHQAECISNGMKPDNIINFQSASSKTRYLIEEAITVINDLMLKAGNDFYTGTM